MAEVNSGNPFEVAVDATITLPDAIYAGDRVTPGVALVLTLPPVVSQRIKSAGYDTLTGTVDATIDRVQGADSDPMTAAGFELPATPVPDPATPVLLRLRATPVFPSVVLDRAGTVSVRMTGDFVTVNDVVVSNAGGERYELSSFNCSTEESFEVASIEVRDKVPSKASLAMSTVVSDRSVSVGDRLFDRVKVTGVPQGDEVTVRWALYGPVKPKNGSCRGLSWSKAKIVGRGAIRVPEDGVYRTPRSKRLTKVGCYSYGGSIAEDRLHKAVTHAPGKRSQTAMVTSPTRPTIPTGTSGFARRGLSS
ncbi:hypothetical protein CCO04_05190 [Pimelobacter sp. 30-1]|nr:hypothetical protein [Pimelobacter sp. 30-1]